MALKKRIITANGLPLEYHKLSLINVECNSQITLLMHSYFNEEARQFEKDYAAGLIEEEYPTFPYVADRYISVPYAENIGALQEGELMPCGYELLKKCIPELADAENV